MLRPTQKRGLLVLTVVLVAAACESLPAATDILAADVVTTDGLATDGTATDGLATDGLATDGLATDGLATDGLATDGTATDGAETDTPPARDVPLDTPTGVDGTADAASDSGPLFLAGAYLVTTDLDLLTGLPGPVYDVVGQVLHVFADPANDVLSLLCLIEEPNMNELCAALFRADGEPTVEGDIAITLIDGIVAGLSANTFDLPSDPGQMTLWQLELVTTVSFEREPWEDGELPADVTRAEWTSVRYRWPYNTPSCATHPGCGWRTLALADIAGAGGEVRFTGRVSGATEDGHAPGTRLTIDPHPVPVPYGALVDHLVESVVIPGLAGDGSDGGPRVDAWHAFFRVLLAGRECLTDEAAGGPTCCRTFAENLAAQTDTIGVSLVERACDQLVVLGSRYFEGLLRGLDLPADGWLAPYTTVFGTEAPCTLLDADGDRFVDTFGTPAAPCAWDALFLVDLMGGGVELRLTAPFAGTRE